MDFWGLDMDYSRVSDKHLLIGLLSRFDNRYQAAADAFFMEISWTQLFCLKGISLFFSAPTIQDMAVFLGCSHQNAAQLLRKLCIQGYVTMQMDAIDKRKQRLYLTPKAERFLCEHIEAADRAMGDIFDGVTEEELVAVIRVMKKLDANLHQYGRMHGAAETDCL